MKFIESFHKFNQILFLLSLTLYKYDYKTKKYQCRNKYLFYGVIYSTLQLSACFAIMWHLELHYYVLERVSVLVFTEILRISALILSSQAIITFEFVNRLNQTKLFNAFNRFDSKLYNKLAHTLNCKRIHFIFMSELLVWSVYFFFFVTLIETQIGFPDWNICVLFWIITYAFFANNIGVTYFFILFSKRHIDFRFRLLVQELKRIVKEYQVTTENVTRKCKLMEELSSVYDLFGDLEKFKRLFKASFGALLSYLILNDMFEVTGNLFWLIHAYTHGDACLLFKFDSFLLDFLTSKSATWLRLFYFVFNVTQNNEKEVRKLLKFIFVFILNVFFLG